MRPVAVLLAAALLLGGCRAGDDDAPTATGLDLSDAPTEQAGPSTTTGSTVPPSTSTSAPATTTTPAGPPSTFADDGPNVAPDGAPTAEELEAAMPPPSVLGDRFTLAFEPLGDMDTSEVAAPFCPEGWPGNHLSELMQPHDVGGVSAGYAYDPEEDGPLVVVRAASFPDATGRVRDVAAQVEACEAAGPSLDEDRVGTYVSDGDPDLGHPGIAVRWVSELPSPVEPITATLHLTLVAVGDVAVLVMASNGIDVPQAPPTDDLDMAALAAFTTQVVEQVDALR